MSQFKKCSLLSMFILLVISCSDETIVFEQTEDNFSLEDSQSVLTNSVSFEKSGALDVFDNESASGKLPKFAKFANDQAGDYPLTLVAQITPPSFTGAENLTATHVQIDGDYAYVSYNTVEGGYAGAADIIDVSDPTSPRVTSRVYSRSIDFNSIQYSDGFAYIVGGMDSEQSALATANSIIIRISANGGSFNTSGILFGFQEGFNANDVVIVGESAFMTSGKDGFITEFNKNTLEIINEAAYEDLRSLAIKDGKYLVLDASVGVRVLNADLSEASQIAIDSDFGEAEKRTLDFTDDKIVVAEGSRGAGVYDFNTGAFQEYIPITTNPANVDASNIVTNATAFNENILLMANGGGGLCLTDDENGSTNIVGIIELEGSINFVSSKDDYIFAASGREGLQIIKINKPSASLQERCSISPAYVGSSRLNVAQGDDLAYSVDTRFREINVDGSLLLCGSWTVRNGVVIGENALFEMSGTATVARNNRRRDITVSQGATFRVEGIANGSLTIWGDLILEENATLEFLGNENTITVHGDVIIANSATVTGNFTDTEGKF
ncbi:hypothetical protein [uncultured Croceitalea sp.]|uniref:hypothetical protein n=1 Tax=uncultured Croceitalea sp. TaxID=1798908 RepID=UPI003305E05A